MTNAKKRLIALDIETTGLRDHEGAVILSIGCLVENNKTQARRGGPYGEFYGIICPTEREWRVASPKALEVNGMTWEFLQANGKPFATVRDEFLTFLDGYGVSASRFDIIGQSPEFDLWFLDKFMGDELRFIGFPLDDPIDIRDLYSILENRKVVPVLRYLSGQHISRALGVPEEPQPHTAIEGARAVLRNYEKLVELGARQ